MLSSEDPVGRASGSSLLSEEANVDPGNALEVETVDLDRFVVELGRPVALLKLDIEGMELPVLRQLTETGTLGRIPARARGDARPRSRREQDAGHRCAVTARAARARPARLGLTR